MTTVAIPIVNTEQRQFYDQVVSVTKDATERIATFPQKSPAWLKARKGRLTASNFGAAAGHNPYCTPRQLLKQMIWSGSFEGNEATRYGTNEEPVACKIYFTFLRQHHPDARIEHPNLLISSTEPHLGCSPDGVVTINGVRFLLEIKCPFKKSFYGKIPPYYYDQITGMMALLHLPFTDFVVKCPHSTNVQRYVFNSAYWEKELKPALDQFYFQQLLPRLVWKEQGKLENGELEPVIRISSSLHQPKITSMLVVAADKKEQEHKTQQSSSSRALQPQFNFS